MTGLNYPPPLFAPGRTLNIRAGATWVTGVQWPGSGYNARTLSGVQYDPEDGWTSRPSEHAYTSAYDFMLWRFVDHVRQRYPMLTDAEVQWRASSELGKLADWLTVVGLDERHRATYGYPNTVIWHRRIWTWARRHEGWRRYIGSNPHTDHVHVDLWCPELEGKPV